MPHLSHEERVRLTQTIVNVLDTWGVAETDQVGLLGLPRETRPRSLRRFREGTPLPVDEHVMECVQHLLGIADALRTTFPRNAEMGPYWMNQPNRHFQNRTPLTAIIEGGFLGLTSVRAHLDCSFAWDRSGSRG